MEKSLQQMFIETHGEPLKLGDLRVIQMDRVPITTGVVTIRFLDDISLGIHGVAIKSPKGKVELSDGSNVKSVFTWDEPWLPRAVSYRVDCPDGELRVWNVFRTKHAYGEMTQDSWTGNAGMIVDYAGDCIRRYRCSAGPGSFDPDQFHFELAW